MGSAGHGRLAAAAAAAAACMPAAAAPAVFAPRVALPAACVHWRRGSSPSSSSPDGHHHSIVPEWLQGLPHRPGQPEICSGEEGGQGSSGVGGRRAGESTRRPSRPCTAPPAVPPLHPLHPLHPRACNLQPPLPFQQDLQAGRRAAQRGSEALVGRMRGARSWYTRRRGLRRRRPVCTAHSRPQNLTFEGFKSRCSTQLACK